MFVKVINNRPVKIWANEVEQGAMQQIANLTTLPFLYHHLAIMPDVHEGKGMPIGGVLACVNAVIPNAVGADIGCGMCAVKSNIKVSEIPVEALRTQILPAIRERIPVGTKHHQNPQAEHYLPQGFNVAELEVVSRRMESLPYEIGTLGGGNHFIELQRDEEDYLWVMIHSGSRNLGHQVGTHYNKVAARLNELWHSSVSPSIQMPFLPLGTEEFNNYWKEMQYCVEFALCNRKLIMERIEEVLTEAIPSIVFEPMINIAHNYAAWENHFGENVIVHRKGATKVTKGSIGIIPGSQGTASYIVEGLGNPDSFCSCSHGAGRVMSRSAAVRGLNLQEEIAKLDVQGIIHNITTERDLEEAAGAYKNIDVVMANQSDLVNIVTRLTPVAVVKG